MLLERARFIIATLWVGSLWTIGYVVAPTLFATLTDRALAGTIAGTLFRIEAWISLTCALVMMVLFRFTSANANEGERKWLFRIISGMLVCTLIGYFGLQPFMTKLREAAGPGGVMESAVKIQFGILHGVSSAIYLVQSLFGVALICKLR